MSNLPDFDLSELSDLRAGDNADTPQKPRPAVLGETDFAYIGQALTVPQFSTYVEQYDFGVILPDYVVLHHTAIPSATYARFPTGAVWDAGESGLSLDAIRNKRKRQLDSVRDYYRDTLNWDRGPHIWIDEKWIWLFTPMAEVGIHAKWGNSFRQAGTLHYSIGIEVVGNYDRVVWPADVIGNVRAAVLALWARLGTFDLRYLYPTNKPGMIVLGDVQKCAHPDRLRAGGISSHRDYNKPQCPGAAITEAFYMAALTATDAPPLPPPRPQVPLTYRVRAGVTAGARVRSAARRSAPVLLRLQPGDGWAGTRVEGELVAEAGFTTGDIWIKDNQGRYVWLGLLELAL